MLKKKLESKTKSKKITSNMNLLGFLNVFNFMKLKVSDTVSWLLDLQVLVNQLLWKFLLKLFLNLSNLSKSKD